MSIEAVDVNRKEVVLPEGFSYHPEGYLWYVLHAEKFADLPNEVIIDGTKFTLKSEFHVTVVHARAIAREISACNQISVLEIENELQELFAEYVTEHEISFIRFEDDLRLAVSAERTSIAARCDVDGIQSFFDLVNERYGLQAPIQPAHVSLYTATGAAVGIDSQEQMESYARLTLPEVQKVLDLI
ncbi:MAG TPA: hypothetical protein VGE31_01585 [Candidatus Paceibacterota bacterium]